jgi:steroid 5-alpha reductase family enzyme
VSLGAVLLLNAGVVLALTTALWAVSVRLHDTSIVDVFWGAGFVVIAWVTFAAAGDGRSRALLLAALTTVWGLRLTLHLTRRNLGKGEDFRYRAMRARHGDRWPARRRYRRRLGARAARLAPPSAPGIARGQTVPSPFPVPRPSPVPPPAR